MIIFIDVERKRHPATGMHGEGLVVCDALTLVLLHNSDLQQCSAAS